MGKYISCGAEPEFLFVNICFACWSVKIFGPNCRAYVFAATYWQLLGTSSSQVPSISRRAKLLLLTPSCCDLDKLELIECHLWLVLRTTSIFTAIYWRDSQIIALSAIYMRSRQALGSICRHLSRV